MTDTMTDATQPTPGVPGPVTESDHVLGPMEAPVTLLEYGDFECPYCRGAHAAVARIRARMGDSLRYVFRNFPLEAVHPNASLAARAAEAAAGQGNGYYWAMQDLLFDNQRALDREDLLLYAGEIGLDTSRFERELDTANTAARVRRDLQEAGGLGLTGTPAFFINGERHRGSYYPNALIPALEAALKVRRLVAERDGAASTSKKEAAGE